jgi:hypothetical protein
MGEYGLVDVFSPIKLNPPRDDHLHSVIGPIRNRGASKIINPRLNAARHGLRALWRS